MNNNLLDEQIKDIQIQYLDLLKTMLPMLQNKKYVSMALDSISLFWRRYKSVIDIYLRYIVKESKTVFYTAATYFDVDNGEQYPFVLMGDVHIFDDPLGKYCEICHQSEEAPKALCEKVSICAKDNIDILEKCNGLIIALPLRLMGAVNEENDYFKLGEKFFLSFFDDIYDLNTYFECCNTMDEVIKYFKDEYKEVICLYEGDSETDDFENRIKRAVEVTKEIMGEGYSIGEYFFFSLFGPLQQALDILMVSMEYNILPLIIYLPALHNVLLLLPNFYNDEYLEVKSRLLVFNYLYRIFDQSEFMKERLSDFYKSVKVFDFEVKALSCYEENDPQKTKKNLHMLINEFSLWKKTVHL